MLRMNERPRSDIVSLSYLNTFALARWGLVLAGDDTGSVAYTVRLKFNTSSSIGQVAMMAKTKQ